MASFVSDISQAQKLLKLRIDYNRGKEAVRNITSAATCVSDSKIALGKCQSAVFPSDWTGDSADEMLAKFKVILTNDNSLSSEINKSGSSLSMSIETIKTTEDKIKAMMKS